MINKPLQIKTPTINRTNTRCQRAQRNSPRTANDNLKIFSFPIFCPHYLDLYLRDENFPFESISPKVGEFIELAGKLVGDGLGQLRGLCIAKCAFDVLWFVWRLKICSCSRDRFPRKLDFWSEVWLVISGLFDLFWLRWSYNLKSRTY